jgi:pimeloyl-ACP methyl ester carboxylesterase
MLTIKGLPLKTIDSSLLTHAREKRGLVKVPFDYSRPADGEIEIFYRLIPAYGTDVNDATKPIIVVINGGPGIPSGFYRPMDFDYEKTKPDRGSNLDRFKYFLNTHRILLLDQRGTDGLSAPLDMDDPNLNANLVAKHFSSDNHARDYLAVINAVIPEGEKFYIIAQSYGGMPGMQYLALPNMRKPEGIVFSASALPYEDIVEASLGRRREQLKLNLQLRKAVPDLETRIAKVRDHFETIGLNPARFHALYTWLGKDVAGVWEPKLAQYLEDLLTKSKEEIETGKDKLEEVSLLNYILSSANFSPGHTDRTLAKFSSEKIPFESWMIDENKMLMMAGQDGTWRQGFIEAFDKNPPPATPFPTIETLKSAISNNKVLFTPADNDAYVPAEVYLKSLAKFEVRGRTKVCRLPGGHHAIFYQKGHTEFLNWSR